MTVSLLALLVFGVSAALAGSVAYDYSVRDVVADGVAVNGVKLSGADPVKAAEEIERTVTEPLMQPVTVTFEDQAFTFEPARSLAVDADSMLIQAFSPTTDSTVAERTYRRIAGKPKMVEVTPVLAVDDTPIDAWLLEVASRIDTPAVEATITIEAGEIQMRHSSVGYRTDIETARTTIADALLAGQKTVALPVETVQPAISEEQMGKTIIVDVSSRSLVLYAGMQVEKAYKVAVGTPGHPTPRGSWTIVNKRRNPSWSNPGSAWAKGMPAYIGPGPSNPLGTRALYLNASGIRIHGTTANSSIGTAASHGCMRMHRWDIEDLFERVPVGTPVLIVR